MALELTPSGLQTQTQSEIFDGLVTRTRATFGPNLNVAPDSIMGQLLNILAEFLALNQQELLSVQRSFDPSQATGVSLDQRAALTGSVRKGATNSFVVGILTFGAAGTANNGDLINNDDNQTQWQLIDGPHTAVGPYPEEIAATFAAVDTGPILANAGTTWSLVTQVPGLTSFTNPTDDANPGRDVETDPDFRVRRQVELYSQNLGGLAAITGVVSKADPRIVGVRTYHNPATFPVDSDGIPFKAFNVVVETSPSPPPADLQMIIFEAILSVFGAGGQAYGTDFMTTLADSEGTLVPIAFDIVTFVDVFMKITLDTVGTEEEVSPNLATVVRDAILAEAQLNLSGLGQDVLSFKINGIIADLAADGQISGVVKTTVELSDTATVGPYADPVPIGIRERPDFDSANIDVVVLV